MVPVRPRGLLLEDAHLPQLGGSPSNSAWTADVRPVYASGSRMERSALIADAVWVCTDPRLIPITEAIRASLISP